MYGRYGCYTVSARFTLVTCPIRPRLPDMRRGPRAYSRRTTANRSHGSLTPTVVLTEPSPVLATAYGSDPLQRSSDRLEGSIIVPVVCHRAPRRAASRSYRYTVACWLITNATTGMYLLKDYAIVNELEELHHLSEAADFIALHLYSFLRPFYRVFLAYFQKFFYFIFR